jgi:tetratricopeptide (TPR) repeat protein
MKSPEKKLLYTIYLTLGRILSNMDKADYEKIKQNYPLYSNPEKLLTAVKNESTDFEEKRTAAILLSEDYKKNNNIGKSIDNFYKFLGENRDPAVEKLFKENLDILLYDLEKKKDYKELLRTWVKIKDRKSFLSADNLLRFGEVMIKFKFYANAEEIYRHMLKYKLYSEKWRDATTRLIRILFEERRYRECLDLVNKADAVEEPETSEFNYYKIISYRGLNDSAAAANATAVGASSFDKVENIFQYRILELKCLQLGKEKKYDEALELCGKMESFTGAAPEDKASLMVIAADLHYIKNETDKSLEYYLEARESGKGLSDADKEWILYRLTSIYRDTGNTPEADKYLARLKQLNPQSFWVRQLEKNVR